MPYHVLPDPGLGHCNVVFCVYKNFIRFTTHRLFSQNPAASHSDIHLHFPFPIADSHARTPKTLILQAFTIGFEVSLFQGWLCEKRRVSVLRCFCTGFLFGVMVSFRWEMTVQVNIFSMFYLMVALFAPAAVKSSCSSIKFSSVFWKHYSVGFVKAQPDATILIGLNWIRRKH